MKSQILSRFALLAVFFLGGSSVFAATYTVTTTSDAISGGGPNATPIVGGLRWAITQANANPGADIIDFNIAVTGNTFENDGAGNSWALITLGSALPVITDAVIINGTTQANTNTGFMPGRIVGVNAFTQTNINYPDVYIVCGYNLPSSASGTTGNGLSVNAVNVTIQGLAISGFGNTSTSQPEGTAHADVALLYSTAARNTGFVISQCFLSCTPRGAVPTTTARQTKGGALLILGNNNGGIARQNYIAHTGGYGIVFHATQNNANSTPGVTPSTNWLIEENQVINIGTSTAYTGGRAADAISMMTVRNTTIRNNYVADWEQFGIDLGHNTDHNTIDNNTLTGFVKTNGSLPCGGIRTAFSSDNNVVTRNRIFNNTSTRCLAGIWADESVTTMTGALTKNNSVFTYEFNAIHNNTGSGITLSTNGAGSVTGVTISRNEIYENTGLGIDLGYNDLSGPVTVTVNDNGDPDSGPNHLQNFPIIDSARFHAPTQTLTVFGKAPAGSIVEVFSTDGQQNNHGGLGLSYGEGRRFLGSGVEGSAADGASGTGSYNMDGNIAVNNNNMFQFTFNVAGITVNTAQLTSTATVGGSTSEFGPQVVIFEVLGTYITSFSGVKNIGTIDLNWKAECDKDLSHFEVEHSRNGVDFSRIGTVRPGSDLSKTQALFFQHGQVHEGVNFYRLKMVNKGGKSTYSKIISVGASAGVTPYSFQINPNPVQNHFSLSVQLAARSKVKLSIVGPDGNIVLSRVENGQAGRNTFLVDDLDQLPKGVYSVMLQFEGKQAVQKIIKQ